MTLLEAHDFIRYILQKERGGWISPEEIDENLHRSQWEYYNQSVPAYGKDQVMTDTMAPFIVKFQFTISNGLIVLPVDPAVNPCYEHMLNIYVQYYDNIHQKIRYKPVEFVNKDELAQRLDHQILEPTITDPLGEQLGTGQFQLYPATSLAGYVLYLRQPVRPFFSYTLSGRTIVYDNSTSVQMEWSESNMNNIVNKAIQLAGINLTDEQIVQYTETKNQQDI